MDKMRTEQFGPVVLWGRLSALGRGGDALRRNSPHPETFNVLCNATEPFGRGRGPAGEGANHIMMRWEIAASGDYSVNTRQPSRFHSRHLQPTSRSLNIRTIVSTIQMKARQHKRRKSQNERHDGRRSKRPRRDDSTEGPSLPSTDIIDLTADSDEDIVQAVAIEKEPGAGYDTCFGLVEMAAIISSSSISPDLDFFPVRVEPASRTIKISAFDTKKVIGSVMSNGCSSICRLQEKVTIRLTANIALTATRKPVTASQYLRSTLRIVIYGLMTDKDFVAKFLSDDDIYLQHPSILECDPDIPYFNPQYFLCPGESMPALEQLKISKGGRSGDKKQGLLTEVEKRQLLHIFESAHDPDARFSTRPSRRLQSVLKEHQISALAMMIEKECGTFDKAQFPAIWDVAEDQQGKKCYRHAVTGRQEYRHPSLIRGGILADEMGLGKTLAAIALILWHMDAVELLNKKPSAGATLIVTPKSTIPEWNQQFEKHVKPDCIRIHTHHGRSRQQTVKEWENFDVILTTYDTLRSERESGGPLIQMEWARVILDEAHTIRNRNSKVFHAACQINAHCRWCLTGTPIQNRLDDFGALLAFIRVPPFQTLYEFNAWIADPIQQRKNYAFKRLRALVQATCLRRTKEGSMGKTLNLPKKEEVNAILELTPGDRQLYDFFRRQAASVVRILPNNSRPGRGRGGTYNNWRQKSQGGGWFGHILPLVNHLRRICDHGEDLLQDQARKAWRERDADSIEWQLIQAGLQKCDSCQAELEEGDEAVDPVELACGHILCASCYTAVGDDANESQSQREACRSCSSRSPAPSQGHTISGQYKPFVKVEALLRNLKAEIGDCDKGGVGCKSVVFTCWTRMLDLIQRGLQQERIEFRRIDGQTSLSARGDALKDFRDDSNCKVMLATIGSVGEGVNLTAANHVHIMEPHWNPMVEAQAIDRVHRIGQQRDVRITRYLIKDSIELYIRGVQQDKLRLIHQSLSATTEVNQKDINTERFKRLLESLK